jgi:hypothetical protein
VFVVVVVCDVMCVLCLADAMSVWGIFGRFSLNNTSNDFIYWRR